MADIQSNIQVGIDTTQALASIKNLQRQISAFHSSMAKGGAAANAVSTQLQQTLINSVNATGQFSAGIRTIRTTTESFTSSLEKNKFSLGEYFRYAGGATKTFGRLFKTEHDTINKVARENVKDLQTQYIRLGRDASGAMKAIAVRPLSLDMTDLGTRTQIAAQKQAIFNQLLKQGSTNLLNFGKNTQWAGRQLMVGFTLPLIAVGSAAAKTFMDMETQAIRFKKVYGDLFTPTGESQQALKDIQELGKEFTKYGIAVSTTVGLAAEAAAAGFKGVDLTRQTTAATKLSILGQVESQKALETTISLQNAFSMSSENLAESIDFLNAVENQTVLSLDDISTAIPKAAPIIQQLGGDVKDLAFLMTAMKEGGINASEGANALKSGLASLINPTGKANDMLLSFGINAKKIVLDNKGDLKKTVVEFATALNMLDPLNRAQAIEQMFGKFQFSRLSTLFANVTKEGTQASRVLDLAGSSVQELAALSEKELGMTSESAMNKFKGAVENLKLSLIPLGEEFLKAITPIAKFITNILEKFDGLSANTKKIIVVMTGVVAGLGPVLLMTFGLIMNGLANMIKLFAFLKSAFNKTGQSTTTLGTEVKYMTAEQRNAAAVAASLDQVHTKLAQTFTSEASAVNALTRAYQRAVAAQSQFVPVAPPITRGPIRKFAGGRPATVGGTGNKDSELALLMPGETVIPTKMSQKYGSIINAMIADKIPGYEDGVVSNFVTNTPTSPVASHFDVTAPSELGKTIRLVGSELEGFSTTVIKLTENVDGSGYTLRKSQAPLTTSVTDDNAVLAGGRSFAGTTTLGSGSRNIMFNALDIKGEPFTLDALSEAGDKAAVALQENGETAKRHTAELERLSREGAKARELLADSNNATRSRIEYMRANAKQAITEAVLADARIKIDGKRVTVQQARVIADQRIAAVDAELETLRKSGVTQERLLLEARKKYLASMIRSGTGEFVVAPAGTGGGVARDYATGRPRSSNRVTAVGAVAGERKAAYGGRGAVQIAGLVAKDFALQGKTLVQSAYLALISGARAALRISSPSREMHDTGSNAGKSLADGAKSKTAEAKKAGRQIGSSLVDGATQSGRARRVATRAQGPAPIGATPQPGMLILPIVPPDPKDPGQPKQTKMQKLSGKMKSPGAGMGVLGANMALSMVGDFAGKGVAQGTLAGASLGMMFGPYGIAAGAAIGLVTSALSALIKKQNEHAASVRATFTPSTEIISLLGDTALNTELKITNLVLNSNNLKDSLSMLSPEVQAVVDAISKLPEDNPLAIFVKNISDSELSLRSLTGSIRSQVTTAISVGGLDPKNAEKYVQGLLAAANRTKDFASVWKSVSKDVVDAETATTVSIDKVADAVRKSGDSFFAGTQYTHVISKSYGDLTNIQKILADQMLDLFSVTSNGSLSFDQIIERVNGLKSSSVTAEVGVVALSAAINASKNPDAIARLAQIKTIFKESGDEAAMTADKIIMMNLALQLTTADAIKNWARSQGMRRVSPLEMIEAYLKSSDFTDSYKQYKEFLNPKVNDYKDPTDGVDGLSKASEAYLKVLDAEIKGLEAKRDAQKNVNDESQRHIDLQMKMKGLANEVVLAKISGDYIKAASLEQQAQNLQMEFDQDTEIRRKDAEIARLKARAEEIRGGASLARSEINKIPKKEKVDKVKKASGGMIRGAGTPTSDSIPAYLSNGEYVIKADSVKKYGVGTFDQLNAGRFADGGLAQDPNKVYLPDGSEARKMSRQERDANYRISRDRFLAQRKTYKDFVMPQETHKEYLNRMKQMGYANGGLIPGYHAGGPVGHRHGRNLPPTNPVTNPYWEQYDPRTKKPFRFPTDNENVYNFRDMLPPSMRPKKPWYEGFKGMFNPAVWGVGTDLRGKEVTGGVVDLPYNIGYKGLYKGLLFPAALMLDRATRLGPNGPSGLYGSPLAGTNKEREAELLARSRAEGFGSVAPETLLTAGLDVASVFPFTGVGSKIGNLGFSEAMIAKMAAEKAAQKAATKLSLEEAGIGLPGMMQSIQSRLSPQAALRKKTAVLREKFEAIKAEGKLLTPEGDAARVELAQYEALLAARLNNFTPLMNLRTTTSKQLIAENQAMPAVIEKPFTLNGKDFVFRFTRHPLNDADAPVIDNFLASIEDPRFTSLGQEKTVGGAHMGEIIDPLTKKQAAYITYDPITGAIRFRHTDSDYYRQGLSEALYNKIAEISRIRHSGSLSAPGRASAPKIGGFMSYDDIYNLPGLDGLPATSSLKTTLQEFIQQSIKPKIPKITKKPKKPKKSIAPTPARPGTPESNYEAFLNQVGGSTSSPSSFGGTGFVHSNPNPSGGGLVAPGFVHRNSSHPREPYIDPFIEKARRRAAAEQAISAEGVDAARISWRENPNRTHDTYPFVNGSLYDYEDNFDLMQLMQQGVSRPAGVPWRSNNQAPPPDTFGGKNTSLATGGYIDKEKLRIPKFAMGGLIKGPGTGISDSIRASLGYAGGGSIRVSNGEYVVKASSVRDYGVKTMDAINNGTATVGTNSGGTVYNINMPVTSNNANPEIVANEVMRKLKLEISKNNKTNKVGG
jgi:TP901 family phage tail tape measure protein